MSGRGGKRSGAGRKKGVGNRSTEAVRRKAAETGELPVDYMLRVMRDPKVEHSRRDDMAKAVGPYLHAKLAAIQLTGKDGGPIEVSDARERLAHLIRSEAAAGTAVNGAGKPH